MTHPPTLSMAGVTFRYGETAAVRDLTLTVPAGTVAGLIGPNGCGKTTTLRLASGLLAPAEGEVVVEGMAMARHAEQAKARFAFAPDAPTGFDHLTVREYLDLYRSLQRADAGYWRRVERLLEMMQLAPYTHRLLGKLSHGTRRKVSIVAAAALLRPLLFLDEATSALDPESVIALESLLAGLSRRGCAALVATQDLYFAERTCDLVYLLARGRLVAHGSSEQLRREYRSADLRDVFMQATGLARPQEQIDDALAFAVGE